jgi:hypothetical protein
MGIPQNILLIIIWRFAYRTNFEGARVMVFNVTFNNISVIT